jgi:RAB protein geranylgeranyltransferase component A
MCHGLLWSSRSLPGSSSGNEVVVASKVPSFPSLAPPSTMNPDEPTHFNVLVAGTGLQESILAACVLPSPLLVVLLTPLVFISALSKSGYSVLQVDPAPYYGAEYASLSLSELAEWTRTTPGAEASSPAPPADLLKQSQRFALSLYPMLLRAKGEGLDLLVRSKVAAYLQFGLLGGVGLFRSGEEGGKVERVPASKADVFNNASLSLVEKRRLTKLLLFAAGVEPFEEDKVLSAGASSSFRSFSVADAHRAPCRA